MILSGCTANTLLGALDTFSRASGGCEAVYAAAVMRIFNVQLTSCPIFATMLSAIEVRVP
jgi:hypothetical protein